MSEPIPPTEQRNPASRHLADMDALCVISLMNTEEHRALEAVEHAAPLLAQAAQRVASCIRAGGRTIFIGAGTSGRIALQEAAELPPTFGVPRELFVVLAAGSAAMGSEAITQTEDDEAAAPQALSDLGVDRLDTIFGIAASGTTPFVRAGLRAAARAGSWTCGIANNPGTPLLSDGALGILLDTGPEILTGSTRLKAGTAQKLALNRITTAAMVLAGHVIENHMVDMAGSNQKFRQRSVRMVMDLTGISADEASRLLVTAHWSIRQAIEMAEASSANVIIQSGD
jgi:N-acetylmuramic acid 6-phosphate etherase